MERTKHRIIIFLLLITSFPGIFASERSEIYNSYISNRMDVWKNIIDRMEADGTKNNGQILELVNYQYGYIGYCIGFKKREEAKKYLSLAEKNIEILEKRNFNPSDVHAYRCAFYGFRIGLNKLSAPVNGVKSLEHGKAALEMNRDNYFGLVQYGNMLFYMPAAFGGSKKEGIEYFTRARELLEKNPSELVENWNYLSLLVIIAQSYTYINDLNSAKAVYENILELEPGFLYVKDELYPELLKKMGK
jgi:tetratricopeptide (TPR) repeat protein